MGSGFIQRLKSPASTDFYKSIEGVYIIDQGGPAFDKGQGTGRVAIIGEFADMLYAVAVDSSGNVTSRPQPVQIFGADDLVAKLGDFDSTLGDIGGAGGKMTHMDLHLRSPDQWRAKAAERRKVMRDRRANMGADQRKSTDAAPANGSTYVVCGGNWLMIHGAADHLPPK